MKNKKVMFIMILLIIILSINVIVPRYSYAENLGLGNLDSYKGSNPNPENFTKRIESVLGVIQVVGTIVSVAMLIVIGIKYMMGSIEERAEYKESLKPYLIGAFLLFTGTLVPDLIYKISQNI